MKVDSLYMELMLQHHFKTKFAVIPNLYWDFGYELDLLVIERVKVGYLKYRFTCFEIEIKISKSDLKADLEKRHGHCNKYTNKLYYAMPDYMQDCIDLVPEKAGVIIVNSEKKHDCKIIKTPKIILKDKYVEDYMIAKFMRLSLFRFWKHRRNMIIKNPKRQLNINQNTLF